jgi:hypothetical protein
MAKNFTNWLTAQQTAVEMNTTSAEICRLLSLGRLSGSKEKQPGRPGNGQWLIDPKSIAKEKRRLASRTVKIGSKAQSAAKLSSRKPR